jgi:hypothetical protein
MSSSSARDPRMPTTRARLSIRCCHPRSGSRSSASCRIGASRISRNRVLTGEHVRLLPEIRRRSPHSPMRAAGRDLRLRAGRHAAASGSRQGGIRLVRRRKRRDNTGYALLHDLQFPPAAGARHAGPGRCVRTARCVGQGHGDDVPLGAAGGLLARRHCDPRGNRMARARSVRAPPVWQQDVDLGRRARAHREISCISCSRRFPAHLLASRAFHSSRYRGDWSRKTAPRASATTWLAGLNHKMG